MIDFIVTNRHIHPQQVMDVRTLSSADAGTDHGLVLCELRLDMKLQKRPPWLIEKLCVEKMSDPAIRGFYQARLRKVDRPDV